MEGVDCASSANIGRNQTSWQEKKADESKGLPPRELCSTSSSIFSRSRSDFGNQSRSVFSMSSGSLLGGNSTLSVHHSKSQDIADMSTTAPSTRMAGSSMSPERLKDLSHLSGTKKNKSRSPSPPETRETSRMGTDGAPHKHVNFNMAGSPPPKSVSQVLARAKESEGRSGCVEEYLGNILLQVQYPERKQIANAQ